MWRAILIAPALIFLLAISANAELTAECGQVNFVIKESSTIVFAEVVDVRCDRDRTVTKVAVERYIKGSGPTNLVIESHGGTEVWAEDQPTFKKGEKGYLFLIRRTDISYGVVCGIGVVNEQHPAFRDSGDEVEKALQQINNAAPK